MPDQSGRLTVAEPSRTPLDTCPAVDPADEFFGQILLKFDRNLATPADLNALVRFVSARPVQHVLTMYGEKDREETRSEVLVAVAEYMAKLKTAYGSLEAAVAGGYARGLPRFVRWYLQDGAKKRNRLKRGGRFKHVLFDDDWDQDDQEGTDRVATGSHATPYVIAPAGSGVRLDGRYVRAEEDEIITRIDEERRRAHVLARVRERLTPEDYEVWRLTQEGCTNQQIAEKLGLRSEGSIRYRKGRIARQLGESL